MYLNQAYTHEFVYQYIIILELKLFKVEPRLH